jgi:bifunctional non-homologous end joining protein LigD
MPVLWKDVRRGLDPKKFTLRSAPALLRKAKLWEGYAAAAQSLADAIRSVTKAPGAKARRTARS